MAGSFRTYLAELTGTFALVFIGAGSVCIDALLGGNLGLVGIALAHGLTLMVMIYTYGHISGGHFNPAVTLALLATKHVDIFRAVGYVIAQLLGAALGAMLLRAVFHNFNFASSAPFLGACDLTAIGFRGGTLVEAVLTFFLMSVIFATAVDARGFKGTAPLAIGMAVSAGILLGGPLTGAALNPARAFGPSVVTGYWNNWFVYWVGPLAGSLTAAFLYEVLYHRK